MSGEKSTTYLDSKDLGTLREKIIFYLSENPNLNAQAVQKGLAYPETQYPNILKALKVLHKLKLINSKRGKSKKGVIIRLYRCTDDGLLYALAKNPKVNALKTIDAYESIEEIAKTFRALYDIMGSELFLKFIRDWNEFMPMIVKDGIDNVAPYIVMKAMMQMRQLDTDVRTRIIKELIEHFPQTRQALKGMAKLINKAV